MDECTQVRAELFLCLCRVMSVVIMQQATNQLMEVDEEWSYKFTQNKSL